MGFTFSPEDLKNIIQDVRKKTSKSYEVIAKEEYKLLTKSEQWSAKKFTIADVFESLKNKKQNKIEIKEYNEINSWENYASFLGNGFKLVCPEKIFTRTTLPKIKE